MAVTATFVYLSIPTPAFTAPARDGARYRAIMAAADHIEKNPHLYSYEEIRPPTAAHPAGCMLGRIGDIYGGKYANADAVALPVLGMSPTEFFYRIAQLILNHSPNFHDKVEYGVLYKPELVAPALRHLAELYRPAQIGLPACITYLFKEPAHV